MKVGDLVKFFDNSERKSANVYIITSLDAYDPHSGQSLPNCIMIALLEERAIIPMHKKYLQVVSKST